jgi:Leucine-rich repeat (LRR) protein
MKITILLLLTLISSSFLITNLSSTGDNSSETAFSIEDIKENKLVCKKIYLNSKSLTTVPKEIFEAINLEQLNLSNNQIKIVPAELAQLKQLEYLNLSKNKQLELKSSLKNLSKSNLKNLNISDCLLAFIPFNIKNLKQLEQLDASNNLLIEFPAYIGKLKKLEEIDLSNNNLSNLDFSLFKCKKLTHVNLENNPKLDPTNVCVNLLPLYNLEVLKLSHLGDSLPPMLGKIKCNQLSISESPIAYFPPTFDQNKIKAISFHNCGDFQNTNLFYTLDQLENLESLAITGGIENIDSLSLLTSLIQLDLSDNDLTKLDLKQADLPNLKELKLYGNEFTPEQLQNIQNQFPSCSVMFEDKLIYIESEMQEDLAVIETEEETSISTPKQFAIIPNQAQEIELNKTLIKIPANAFLDENGKVIKEDVIVSYREFQNPLQTYLAGIPMKYDSAGVPHVFESAGMFELTASSQGKEVFTNPKSQIVVELATTQTDPDYNLYSLDTASGQWSFEGTSEYEKIDNANNVNYSLARPANPRLPIKPRLSYPNMYLKIDVKNKHSKNRTLYVQPSYSYYSGSVLMFPYPLKSKTSFQYYNEKQTRTMKKELSAFNKSSGFRYNDDSSKVKRDLIDWDFAVNRQLDCYDITMIYKDTVISVPVKLTHRSPNNEKEQKYYQGFWNKHLKSVKATNKKNKKVIDIYESSLDRYEEALKLYEDQTRNWEKTNKSSSRNVRSVVVSNFGMWNCDRIGRMNEPERLAVTFKGEDDKKFEALEYLVIDYTDNGSQCFKNNQIVFDKRNKIALIAFGADSKIAFVNHDQFEKYKDSKNRYIVGTIVSLDDMKLEDLLRLIY